jgi:hypothetical protein
MGVRSTHGAFVDMALTGPPTGGGGRHNGVEARAVEQHRLDSVRRHRCIRARLAPVAPSAVHVLHAAFGVADWVRAVADPLLRADLETAVAGVPPEVLRVLPLTEAAQAHSARRQAPVAASDEPVLVLDASEGVRCAYRPAAPPPKAKKGRPVDPSKKAPETPRDRLRRYLAAQPGLAGTAVGHVMQVALGEDRGAWRGLLRAGADLVARARAEAGVQDPPRRRSIQASHNIEARIAQ